MGLSRANAGTFLSKLSELELIVSIHRNTFHTCNFCTRFDESGGVTEVSWTMEAKSNWKILNASPSGNVAIVSNSRATNVFPLSSLLSGFDASANLSATKDHPETRNFDEKFVVPRLLQTCRPMFK